MPSFNDVYGQEAAKRAVEIALAGNHSLLLIGPPGCGKTMLIEAAEVMRREKGIGGDAILVESRPCPCGYYGHSLKECICEADEIHRFRAALPETTMRISLEHVPFDKLWKRDGGEDAMQIFNRIKTVRKKQSKRLPYTGLKIPDDAGALLRRAVNSLGISARAYAGTIEVSRTIADLDNEDDIHTAHVAEAIQYNWIKLD